ncbi:G protein-activated inward rectifier potassium channel 3 isoform X2 [Anoplophora glabripennis]|uniref:G protein-activated inward rectifier potassium channel 3 isoform X2 n=1 Tax=Anoplophora glabripennis TaxID=217634 RepID=UPI000874A0BA|nr:G protein-activated inward rectifier potassium channel 3 isoform X2 [Anoplophora glabripennis]
MNSPELKAKLLVDAKLPSILPPLPTNGQLTPGIYYGSYPSTPSQKSKRSFRLNAARRMRRRAIFKNGDCNILQSRISKRRLRYLQDIFTTLVDSQWRWTLTIFALAFLGSWLIFALFWWLIAYSHDDLSEEHLPTHQADSNWTPCVLNIYGFTSCFLFSIETQHTIGYGVRTTTEECPEAIFVMCFQSIVGMIIQAFMCGIVFAKMTRPKLRTQTLQFSKNAVICQREGYLSLMFRVGDMRKSHIIGASIRAQLICSKKTKEGEVLNNFQTELTVNADGCDGNLFFIWPMTIVHRIDEDSPFYQLSAADMLQDRFEIVVILEGTIESTGQTTQARSSYLATEVLWGHRFEPVVSYNKDRQGYEVNYSKFDNTVTIDTPLCSAADLAAFYKAQDIQEQRSESDKGFPEETNPQSSSYFYLEPAPQGKPKDGGLSPPEIFGNHAKEEQICQTFEFPEPITPFENNFNFPKRTARRGSLPGFVRSASKYDFVEKTYYDVPEEEDEDCTKLGESQHWRI